LNRRLHRERNTSEEGEIEFDNIVSSLVEIEEIRADVGLLASFVEVLLDHVEKLRAFREGSNLLVHQ
jgi:hypothetical protein